LESNTASFAKTKNERAVFGDVPCDLSQVDGPIHLVGIGGIGMSALARLLLASNRSVSGSDKQASEITRELANLGATIHIGHQESNLAKAKALVVSTAITADNPELALALKNGLPVFHRSRVLAALAKGQKMIAVSGTHGKTTTTGMIAQVLIDCGLDPSVVIGGIFSHIKANAVAGKGEYFVAESDESDGTHASLDSEIAVLTNVEADHLENYPGGMEQIYKAMADFGNRARLATVICDDDSGCQAVLPHLKGKVISYGLQKSKSTASFKYESLKGFAMRVYKSDKVLGELELSVPGEHNKLNALAAIVVACELGLNFSDVCASLHEFKGVDRRFQFIGEAKGIMIIDDYAHHPTEIVATLKAARSFINERQRLGEPARRLVVAFQPHQPGRLRDFWDEFRQAFLDSDLLLVSDVYVARGGQIEGINSKRFAQEVQHSNCHYLSGPTADLAPAILKHLKGNDLVITVGAGDITTVGPNLIHLLKQA
jgi:UDP-N-acetylmuramate--alanine ligase